MHYHLVSTDGLGSEPNARTFSSATEAEREALRAAMNGADWVPKRYPGRTWKRGEVVVYLDRTATAERPPIRREVSVLRCGASTPASPDCLLRSMGIPALNLEPGAAPDAPPAPAPQRGAR